MIEGKQVRLRALEPEDIDFLYKLENNQDLWEYTNTQTPYSRYVLKEYLKNSLRDIYEVKQLRLAIMKVSGEAIGLIDLFDFDPYHRRAGLGVIISTEKERGNGFAAEAVDLFCSYAFKNLGLHQIYANIDEENTKSISLFEKSGFKKVGIKKDWNYFNGKYKNELLYQLIQDVH